MEFIKEIQERLKLSSRQMAIKLKLYESNYYKSFKEAKRKISLVNLVRLYEISGLTATEFMALLQKEAAEIEKRKETESDSDI